MRVSTVVRSVLALATVIGALIFGVGPALAQAGGFAPLGGSIDGEAEGEGAGRAVAMSANGTRVVVGSRGADGTGDGSGRVRVFDFVGRSWSQVGGDIDGAAERDAAGSSVAISNNGARVAIGSPGNSDNGDRAGHVRVFDLIGGTWSPVGAAIEGEASGDASGTSVALSANGGRVAIGAITNDGNGTFSGHVRVFDLVGGSWSQVGGDIDGESSNDFSGGALALSADGGRVAIGAALNNGGGSDSGHVRVFDLVGGSWSQVGPDINGESADNNSGFSVSLSADGSRVAIGATNNNGNGQGSGHVRVFDLVGSLWQKVGGDIDGEAAGDGSGISVSLSDTGSRLAVGAIDNGGNGASSGHVRVFDFVAGEWDSVGSDIDGESANDNFGRSVSLSADGSRVVVGAPGDDTAGIGSGSARVFSDPTTLICGALPVTVVLADGEVPTNGDDVILGTPDVDVINALGGDDTICGFGGDDVIDGGDGVDRIFAGAGDDQINGGAGNDFIAGGAGRDWINGNNGNDRILGGDGADVLNGGGGIDTISGRGGNDVVNGGTHDDILFGNIGLDRLNGDGGNDVLRGGFARDAFDGGAGGNDACTLSDPNGLVESRVNCEAGLVGR